MSRTTLLAGIVAAAFAVAPRSTHAQSVDGTRALLARVESVFPSSPTQATPIDRERALLATRITETAGLSYVFVVPAEPIGGAYALLVRR